MTRVAVVLPMFNEADDVAPLLDRLAAVREQSGLDLIALAVDDGSRDATYTRLVEGSPRYAFLRIERHQRNQGMAAALRTGIAAGLAQQTPAIDVLAFMDADLSH